MGYPPSPVRSPLKARLMNEVKESEMDLLGMNDQDTKERNLNKTGDNTENERKIEYTKR